MTKELVKKEPKLTIKQRKWLKLYLKTGNASLAARDTYSCTLESARRIGSENLSKLDIKLKELMEAKGLSIGDLIDDIQQMRKATKIVTSHTEPDYEHPDWTARAKAVDIASKWLGIDSKSEQSQLQQVVIQVTRGEE